MIGLLITTSGQSETENAGQSGAKSGGQSEPENGGQSEMNSSGQSAAENGGQGLAESGGQFSWILHKHPRVLDFAFLIIVKWKALTIIESL